MRRFACKLDRMESMMKSSRADAASQEENSTDEFKVSLLVQNPLSTVHTLHDCG